MEPLAEPGLQNVRVGLFIASGEEEAGVGETFAAPADGSAHRQVTESSGSSVASGSPVPRHRTFAPGIHALRSLRAAIAFALLSCAHRRGRLTEHGRPLAEERWLAGEIVLLRRFR